MTALSSVCSCGAYALAATIFYKKNFQRSGLPTVCLCLLVGLLSDTTLISAEVSASGITIAAIILIQNDVWVRNAFRTDMFLAFFVAICDVRYGFCAYIVPFPSTKSFSASWEMARVILVAMPQFLRKPTWLKAKLQGLRSKLGPMYVLFVASYFFSRWGSHDNMLADKFGLFVAMVALIAGTVFRPDNATVFDLFDVRSTHSQRRYLHRQCMSVTLVSCCVMFVIEILC